MRALGEEGTSHCHMASQATRSRKQALKRPFKAGEDYGRGPGITRKELKRVPDIKLKGKLRATERKVRKAAHDAAKTELLLTTDAGYLEAESGLEKTYHFRQDQIVAEVDVQSGRKHFELTMSTFGPYRHCYSRDGRHLVLGGRMGHLALMDWHQSKLLAELQVKETVRDVCFLHSHAMFAAAQKKDLFLYDASGIELHRLRSHRPYVNRLVFLPYHFLLCTVGKTGHLRYLDVSTGQQVAEHATKLGECSVLVQNPTNAILHLGHQNGTVTLWSPNLSTPHVRMLCHTAPLSAAAVDGAGRHMVTSALDGRMKVWDLRTYKELHTYYSSRPAHSLALSARSVLAVGHGPHVEMWRDALHTKAKLPYMSHLLPASEVETVQFCPHEDVLGVGHASGFASLLVPGSGEPAFDSFEANPYATKKQRYAARGRRGACRAPVSHAGRVLVCRREAEVAALLEKIQPEMITLDSSLVGTVDRSPAERNREAIAAKEVAEAERKARRKEKKKTRGRSKSVKKLARKNANIHDAHREKMKQALEKRDEERKREKAGEGRFDALDRFQNAE